MKTLGPYELLRKLGTGATAEVFLAHGPTPSGKGLLALKVILPHLAEEPGQLRALVAEARHSTGLRHENLVEVYEVAEVDGRPTLAMELVRGYSLSALDRRMKARGERLTPGEACQAVLDAARGLHFAHEAKGPDDAPLGITHRDVSPHNLILDETGRVKVVDFGLAKATLAQDQKTGGLRGKLPYMPPEQLKGLPIDRRADVFALGAVLFELCTGQKLHPGATQPAVIQQALYEPQPRLDLLHPGLNEKLVELVHRALERDLDKRLPTALALAQGLEPLIPPNARRALAARLKDHFAPLPRTTTEALEAAQVEAETAAPLVPLPQTMLAPTRLSRSPLPSVKRPSSSSAPAPAPRAPPEPWELAPTFTSAPSPAARAAPEAWEVPPTSVDPRPSQVQEAVTGPNPPSSKPPRPSSWRKAGLLALLGAGAIGAALATARREEERRQRPAPAAAKPPALASAPDAGPRKEAAARPRGRGTLELRSNVPALVSEKGEQLGMTPLSLSLPAGKHVLQVKGVSAQRPVKVELVIPAGGTVWHEVLVPEG